MARVHEILEHPAVYRMAQCIFAPGAETVLCRRLKEIHESLPPHSEILDVGCGPESWLFRLGLKPTGLDLSESYIAEWVKKGARGVVGSADALPFAEASFDGVWSIGLLHHLPDDVVQRVMSECARVCRRNGGYAVVLDAVLPKSAWCRPLAWWIRRMDRGQFMRTEEQLQRLLHPDYQWATRRITYALTGLELLVCVCRFEPKAGSTRAT